MAQNLWDYYSSKGQALPSVAQRRQQFNLPASYTGTAAQNQALLGRLQGGNIAPNMSVNRAPMSMAPQTSPSLRMSVAPQMSTQPATLAGYFSSQGKALPSVAQRRQLYNLPASYTGTAAQNTALLARLRSGGTTPGIMGVTVTRAPKENIYISGSFVSGTPEYVTDKYGNTVHLPGLLTEVSKKYGVPTSILSAQLKQESGFNPNAGSVAGAKGIAQFIDSTARAYGIDAWNVKQAVEGQARMMSDLLKRYGSTERALSAYNSGNPDRYKDPNFRTSYGSVGETSNYVRNIKAMAGQAVPSAAKPMPTLQPQPPQVKEAPIGPTIQPTTEEQPMTLEELTRILGGRQSQPEEVPPWAQSYDKKIQEAYRVLKGGQ